MFGYNVFLFTHGWAIKWNNYNYCIRFNVNLEKCYKKSITYFGVRVNDSQKNTGLGMETDVIFKNQQKIL